MLYNDTTAAKYMGSGPVLPGEDIHTAMGENTAYNLAGHLLRRPIQGISNGPTAGHGFEGQPVDSAERDAQHVAQGVSQGGQEGQDNAQPTFHFSQAASQIRAALRPGEGA